MKLLFKAFVLVFCICVYVLSNDAFYMVVPVVAAVTLSALVSFFDRPVYSVAGIAVFSVLGLFFPVFLYFAPLFIYDVFAARGMPAAVLVLIPAAAHPGIFTPQTLVLLVMLSAAAGLFKFCAVRIEAQKKEYQMLRDDAKELSDSLARKNSELMQKQDYEVNLATLRERNRIAREIHDSVGHVMSRAILQVGALIATRNDPSAKQSLQELKATLGEGMDSLRRSVHDMHDETVDLEAQLYGLVREFTYCRLDYEYAIDSAPSLPQKYAVLAIVKEALSNIIRHSNASVASLTLRELPGFYQLVVSDNGTPRDTGSGQGMGLQSITARVEGLRGNIHIDGSRGFRLFITFPKEAKA